jgi:methyl-accepting chemotaxis protein
VGFFVAVKMLFRHTLISSALIPFTVIMALAMLSTRFFAENENVLMLVIGILVNLGLGAALIVFLKKQVGDPMGDMTQRLREIAEGTGGDLTKQLDIQRADEVGDMATVFNLTLEKVRKLMVFIKKKGDSLGGTGTELLNNMSETSVTINKITSNIQNMKTQTASQSAEVKETIAAMERIMENINTLNDHITVQADRVSQASSAVEQMLMNIRSMVETLSRNVESVNALAESSEIGKADLQTVSQGFQEIVRESEGLLEINAVMNSIASQTNLLSMNAAIEAAHAGEVGKGFAVVADEIRKLAESSGEQSKTTSAMLKKIKASIDTLTQSTAVVLNRFETIDREVRMVSEQEQGLRAAMEEQQKGNKNILDAITQLHTVTEQVKRKSIDITDESKEVIKKGSRLEQITGEITHKMDEMMVGADHITIVVNRVNQISEENKSSIDSLTGEIAQFKVE